MKSAMWPSHTIDASTIYSPASAAFSGARTLRIFQGTDLTGIAGHNLVAWPVQSGCLPCGSLLTAMQRQSAIRHRLMAGRPAAASALFSVVASHHTRHPAVMAKGHHCLAFASSAANLAGSRPQVLVNRPACRRSASIRRLARCFGIRQNCNQSKGVLACQGQTSASKARLACSHRRLLLAPA